MQALAACLLAGGAALAAAAAPRALAATAPAPQAAAERPNVVVVMTDDQDFRSMWAMPKTRRLLGRAGTTFTRAYASYPLCCPSRATFLTGQHSHNHGVWSNQLAGGMLELDPTETLPVWLRRAGYVTAHVGRYLNGSGLPLGRELSRPEARREVPPGWSRWLGLVDPQTFRMYRYRLNLNGREIRGYPARARFYQTDVLGRLAANLVRRLTRDERPLFLSLATLAPHTEVRPAFGQHAPRPAPRHRGASKRKPFRKAFTPPPSFNAADLSGKPERVQALPRLDAEQRRGIRHHFRNRAESLMAVDDAVAGIVRGLRLADELRNTLLIFTSDQGLMMGEHRLVPSKRWLYEESARVPLIVRGPGVPAGARRGQIVSNVDLAATVLDAAAATPGPGHEVDGVSLLPLARDPTLAASRAILLATHPPGGPNAFAGVRTRGWAYLEHGPDAEELYDMGADPHQLTSLHDGPAHEARKLGLQELLGQLRDCAGTTGPASCYRELPGG